MCPNIVPLVLLMVFIYTKIQQIKRIVRRNPGLIVFHARRVLHVLGGLWYPR